MKRMTMTMTNYRYCLKRPEKIEVAPDGKYTIRGEEAVFQRIDDWTVESRKYDRTLKGGSTDAFIRVLTFKNVKKAKEYSYKIGKKAPILLSQIFEDLGLKATVDSVKEIKPASKAA